MRSLYDAALFGKAIDPVAASSVQTSAAIDTLGYSTGVFVIENGAATGTPSSYTVDAKLQECATSGGSYTDVSGAAITQLTADSKLAVIRVEGLGISRLRYLKLLITPAMTGGTSPKAIIAGQYALARGFNQPPANVT